MSNCVNVNNENTIVLLPVHLLSLCVKYWTSRDTPMKYYSNITKTCTIMFSVLFWSDALDFYRGWNCFLIFLQLQAAFCILIKYFYFWMWLYIMCHCNKLLHLQRWRSFFIFWKSMKGGGEVSVPTVPDFKPSTCSTMNSVCGICFLCWTFVCTEITCHFCKWRFLN